MPTPRRHTDNAARQRAYRQRLSRTKPVLNDLREAVTLAALAQPHLAPWVEDTTDEELLRLLVEHFEKIAES